MAGNAARRILKNTLDEVPLWKRKIPRYPLYYMGDPQLKVLLPQFWMKVVKPKYDLPPDRVHFIVHPQMSKHDIKQYLEKIYNVQVREVRTTIRKGKFEILRPDNRVGTIMQRNLPMDKFAFVTMANAEFKYPDYFDEGVKTDIMEMEEEFDSEESTYEKTMENKSRLGVPPWFWR